MELLPPVPSPGPTDPPRLTAKVLGFRAWTLVGYKLRSAVVHWSWTIGVNEARCKRVAPGLPRPAADNPSHVAPVHGCECGLYAFNDPAVLGIYGKFLPDPVYGAVLAWGRIEAHGMGFRAQYAEPVLLAYLPWEPDEHVKRLEAIAGEMAIPLVGFKDLAVEAAKHGDRIPVKLRPSPVGGIFAPGGVVFTIQKRRPSWTARLPMQMNAVAGLVNLAVGLFQASPLNIAVAGWCAVAFWLCRRLYRRRYR